MSDEYRARETHHLWVVAGRRVEASESASAAEAHAVAGYDFLITSLWTGAVHDLRMVFVGELPNNLRTTYRSLSRRQIGVLRMIAQGMSNKCIARSLGIAPETVKTHAKGILRKLRARTRAQAVARAEAIGLL